MANDDTFGGREDLRTAHVDFIHSQRFSTDLHFLFCGSEHLRCPDRLRHNIYVTVLGEGAIV